MTTVLTTGFCTGSFLAYSLALLEVDPKYICTKAGTGIEYECTRDDFCGKDVQYRIDWTDDASLHNWVEQLDLTCTPKA